MHLFTDKPLAKRMAHVQYAIRELYPVAEKIEREGGTIAKVNIGDPVPYFGTPKFVLEAYSEAVLEGKTGYGRSPGETCFQEAISERYSRLYKASMPPDDIFVTHGISEGIQFINTLLLEEGSGCIMFSPYYSADLPMALERGGKAYFANSVEEKDWGFSETELEKCVQQAEKDGVQLKYINLINPCNPTGSVWGRRELEKIARFARDNKLLLVSDETYDEMVFGGEFTSMSQVAESQPLVILNGLSKNWRATGLRIGWMALKGEGAGMDSFRDGLTRLSSIRLCAGMAQQYAGAKALAMAEEHKREVSKFTSEVEKRSKHFCKRLNEIPGISCQPAKGTFYLFAKVDLALAKCRDDSEFIRTLLSREHVWAVQGSGFGCGGHFRVVCLPPLEAIDKACDGIARMMK